MIELDSDTNCYSCKLMPVCHARRVVSDLLATWPLDVHRSPGGLLLVSIALASACLVYEKDKECVK